MGGSIHIEWAKNMQQADQWHVVWVLRTDSKPHLCPTRALAYMIRFQPGLQNSRLIAGRSQVLMERVVRQRLNKLVTLMGLRAAGLSNLSA